MKKENNIVIPSREEESLVSEVLTKLLENESININEESESGMQSANAIRKLKVYNWPIEGEDIDYCICRYFIKIGEVPAKIRRMAKLMLPGRV